LQESYDARDRFIPELLPVVHEAVWYDRYGVYGSRRISADLQSLDVVLYRQTGLMARIDHEDLDLQDRKRQAQSCCGSDQVSITKKDVPCWLALASIAKNELIAGWLDKENIQV
jgi:hypothetical protein